MLVFGNNYRFSPQINNGDPTVQLRRVVVTGMGMLSPVGGTLEESWKNLLAGKSGITTVDHFDTTDFSVKVLISETAYSQ